MKEKENTPILKVEDLTISFGMYGRGMDRHDLEVVHELSLEVFAGEIVAVVGSSGSGKSLLAHAILGILPDNAKAAGSIQFCGKEMDEAMHKKLRGKEIAFIPQSVEYLDPLMKVGKQVIGAGKRRERREKQERLKEVFKRYQLEESVAEMYPYQLSGGMARRVLISGAVMDQAKLIVADEPTPGLNVEMAMETLQNFRELADAGCGVLLITHDIDLAFQVADKIAVFYAGTAVELAPVEDFAAGKEALRHPYSKAFLDALPQNEFRPIKGFQPYAGSLPKGCLFADRCTNKTAACEGEIKMRSLRGGEVRCVHAK